MSMHTRGGAHQKEGMSRSPAYPSFTEAFRFWLKLGFISFGGPAGQIAIMHEFIVEQKKWVSESRFLHALNYCMLLPGPEAQQLATYIGWLLHGTAGGITAGVLFILPSLLILLGLSLAYVTFGKFAFVAAIFYGLKPAVVAIVLVALIKIGKRSLKNPVHFAVAIASFVGIFFFEISFPLIVLAAFGIALLTQQWLPSYFSPKTETSPFYEEGYVINKSSPIRGEVKATTVALQVIIGMCLWALPASLIYFLAAHTEFWIGLANFFTKAALVTFGGAYAVLPYVAQVSVEKYHWLSELQMIDGLALGETTPGPLIMVLVFVGFMAGYNHFSQSLMAGTIGLMTSAYYTFLPSFLFILIGAPLVERTKENKRLQQLLSIITAAVVGVILNLTIYLAQAVLLGQSLNHIDWIALLWLTISFVALQWLRINMILWIVVSGLAGLLYYLLT